ncbi:MAG: hypothetical protein ACRC0G_10775 [Fusobacteriaceae bacterium]
MDVIVAFVVVTFLYMVAGIACVEAWKDGFDDIETRWIRVSGRIAMIALWPAWLVIWVLCVMIGLFILAIMDIFK